MNIRDVHGVSSQQELYELATVDHKLHAGSMDSLIRFAIEIQRRALETKVTEGGVEGASD
jgi:hypothetical protein